MQLFQVECCGIYPTIHLYFLENTNDLWDIPIYTGWKSYICYGQGMKQIIFFLIGRYKLSLNYYFNYSSWEWFCP